MFPFYMPQMVKSFGIWMFVLINQFPDLFQIFTPAPPWLKNLPSMKPPRESGCWMYRRKKSPGCGLIRLLQLSPRRVPPWLAKENCLWQWPPARVKLFSLSPKFIGYWKVRNFGGFCFSWIARRSPRRRFEHSMPLIPHRETNSPKNMRFIPSDSKRRISGTMNPSTQKSFPTATSKS